MSTYSEDGDYWHDRWEEAQEEIARLRRRTEGYEQLKAEREAIEAENERLRLRADNHRFLSDKYDEHVGELEAEVERLREALGRIADESWARDFQTVSGFARSALEGKKR